MQTPRWRQSALLLVTTALLFSLLSSGSWGQSATTNGDEQLVSIDVKEAPIDQVLRMLAKAANVNILIGQDVQGTIAAVSLKDVTVEAALRLIAKSQGFNWWKEENIYMVSKQPPPSSAIAETNTTHTPGPVVSNVPNETSTTVPGSQPLTGATSTPLTAPSSQPSANVTAGPPALMRPVGVNGSNSVGAIRNEPPIRTEMLTLRFADAKMIALSFGGTYTDAGGALSNSIRPSDMRKANSFSRGGGLSGSDVFQGGFASPSGSGSLGWGQFSGGGGGRGGSGGGRSGSTSGGSSNIGGSSGGSRLSGGSSSMGGGVLGGLMPGEMEPPIAYLPENALMVQGTQDEIDKFREILELLDKPAKQVEISTKFIEVTTDAAQAFGIDWTINNGSLEVFNQGFAPGEAVNNVVRFARGRFDATLSALLSSGRGTVVNENRVVAMNNQYAEIDFSTTIPYFVANISYNQFGQRTVDFTNEEIDVNNSLYIQPRINADDTVTCLLEPQIEDVVGEVEGPNGERVPIVTSQFISTQVRVADGETVVMGGMVRKQETQTLRETPLLSRIPIIGRLFQSRRNVKNNSELLIFMTPRIIRDIPTQ